MGPLWQFPPTVLYRLGPTHRYGQPVHDIVGKGHGYDNWRRRGYRIIRRKINRSDAGYVAPSCAFRSAA